MKKLYYTILATAAALTTASCVDLLNTAPENQIASENMWTTPELALKGMNGLYETFYNRKQSNGTQVRSENLDGLNKYGIEALGFCTDYYANNYPIYLLYNQAKRANDWQLAHEWRFCYTIVHAANDAVTNLHKAGLDAPTYERYLCEARFLRAWAYSRLNKFWQGVPVYLEPISNEQCTRTQESAEYVWREVVLPDLKYCIDNASFPDNTLGESNFGRPSKGAAYALRGMAYMWLKEWQNAANDFEQVGQCGYDLWRGEYIDFFSPDNERDNEMIFAIQYDEESGYCDNIQQAVGARDTYGGWDEVKPASDFVDYYQNDDGTEFKWSQVTGLENWDQLTPRQRAVFFCRDGLKSNAKLASQKTQAIGICGQDIFDRYYLDNGNEARIKAAYDKRDPRLKQTIVTPYEPVDCFTAGTQRRREHDRQAAPLAALPARNQRRRLLARQAHLGLLLLPQVRAFPQGRTDRPAALLHGLPAHPLHRRHPAMGRGADRAERVHPGEEPHRPGARPRPHAGHHDRRSRRHARGRTLRAPRGISGRGGELLRRSALGNL